VTLALEAFYFVPQNVSKDVESKPIDAKSLEEALQGSLKMIEVLDDSSLSMFTLIQMFDLISHDLGAAQAQLDGKGATFSEMDFRWNMH